MLEWVARPSSRGSSWPRDQTQVSFVSCIGRQILYAAPPGTHGPWRPLRIVLEREEYSKGGSPGTTLVPLPLIIKGRRVENPVRKSQVDEKSWISGHDQEREVEETSTTVSKRFISLCFWFQDELVRVPQWDVMNLNQVDICKELFKMCVSTNS